MPNIKSGWKRAAVFNPANGDTVSLARISTEFSAFAHPNIQSETTVGLTYGGKDVELVLGILESDGIAQLETWLNAHTPVNAVVYGTGESVFFLEDVEQLFERGVGVNARDGVAVHQSRMTTVGESPAAFPAVNALSKNAVWTTGQNAGNFPYPIEGATLTVAADYSALSGSVDLIIRALDYGTDGTDGTVLATTTVTVSNGRISGNITLPATTYAVDINFLGNTGSATVANRSLRVDGSAEYVDA